MKLRTLCLTVLSCLMLTFASTADAQKVVAKMRAHTTSAKAMTGVIVRGALPLPRGYTKPLAGLALRAGGKILPTQMSVLSTYPGSDKTYPVGAPEVVQLIARTDMPAGLKEFDVIERVPPMAGPIAKVEAGAKLAAVLAGKAPVIVEASDCYNNIYRANVLAPDALVETRQIGPLLSEQVYQSALVPVKAAAAGKPALKTLLRVRAYLTTYAGEEFASLAIMIYNGSVENPNGRIYYRHIRVGVATPAGMDVWLPQFSPAQGEQAVRNGYTWQDCPATLADGKVFTMSYGSAGVLRTTLYAPAAKARAIQFANHAPLLTPTPSQELFSWSNFATARYGGAKYPMPLSVGDNAMQRADKNFNAMLASPSMQGRLKSGVAGRRALGHALPAGTTYGGKTGGDGVYYAFGARAAVTGHSGLIKLHVLLADRHWDRQREHFFHDDGKPFTFSRILADRNGKKVVTIKYGHFGKWKFDIKDPAAKAQAKHVKTNNLLSGQAKAFLAYMDHDDQHLSRLFDATPAAYLACDPLNRDRLVTLGTQSCWKLSIYPLAGNPNSGGWLSLFGLTKTVNAKPHQGVALGRSHGWVTHALGAAFALCQDKQIRSDIVAAAKANVEMLASAQMPSGNVQSSYPTGKALIKSYFIKPENKAALAAYQKTHVLVRGWEDAGVMANGARTVANILASPANQEYADKMKKVYAKVIRWNLTAGWHERTQSPGFIILVPKSGKGKTIPFGQPTSFMMGSTITWGYELTGDKFFLDKLTACAGKRGVAGMAMRHPNLGNWSYALWLTQGGKIPGR